MADSLSTLVAGHNRFGFDIFAAATGRTGDRNAVLSPASLLFALGMTWNGAAGATREEMARVLGLSRLSTPKANEAFSALRRKLSEETPGVEIAEADSLWVSRKIELKPAFQELCRRIFGAEVESVDFSSPDAARAIIDWGLEKTLGKVDLTPFSTESSTTLVLVNAIFFQGFWTEPFDPERTREAPFTLADGTRKQVPMMKQGGELWALEEEGFQAVRLFYGEERRFAFEAYLPAETRSLPDLLADLTADCWQSLAKTFRPVYSTTLSLPRFAFSWGKDLVQSLKSLGMEAAFGPADFSSISSTSMFISQVIHKARVEVDEKGTTAAAVTVVKMSRSLNFEIVFDRPFFWTIRDLATGAALFLGVVADPTADNAE